MTVKMSWAILIANALIPVAIVIFASGFFPHKPILPGLAEFNASASPPAVFDKVVFMVVDALRRYVMVTASFLSISRHIGLKDEY